MDAVVRGIDVINKGIRYLLGIILAVMAIVIAYQVFSRFALGTSLSWSEELTRYLMIWLVFLGTSIALREKSLIGINILVERFPFSIQKIITSLVYIASIIFFLFIIYKGINVLDNVQNQRSPAMRISMMWAYAAVPVGAFFMLLNSIVVLFELNRRKE
ncbi:TRAP transporter small permease [Alteribacter natronophilus]|uniref:TRAP transporter small permease n=1 Tax=Alteribacter natronophilus TaxID=2583810 RepID=UPI00110E0411|nr:TRAP transporter small permease [Alteribacter natronophilus]TMW72260.1 TRAP transporter small permease [Alteribacter natronophilus]